MRKLALGLVALTFASSAAIAQTPITFAQVDLDGDGRLSFAELQAVWPDLTEADFAAVDVEGMGSITPAQLDTMQPATLGTSTTDGVPVGAGSGELDLTLGDPTDTGEIDNAQGAALGTDRSLLDTSDDN